MLKQKARLPNLVVVKRGLLANLIHKEASRGDENTDSLNSNRLKDNYYYCLKFYFFKFKNLGGSS